jgi:hypothetical protein
MVFKPEDFIGFHTVNVTDTGLWGNGNARLHGAIGIRRNATLKITPGNVEEPINSPHI